MAFFSKSIASIAPCLLRRFLPLLFLLSLLYLLSRNRFQIQSPPDPIAMDTSLDDDTELQYEFLPFLRLYKSGRVERMRGTAVAAPGADAATGVVSKDVTIDPTNGLAARVYLPAEATDKMPILVYFHGGAFVVESSCSPTYHQYMNMLAAACPLVAVSVDYRLAPEHPLPAAYDDAFSSLEWVAANARSGPEAFLSEHGDVRRVFVAGDSAGGNIAHNAVLRAGKERSRSFQIAGMVLANPYFWGKRPVGAETTDAAVRARMASTWGFVCNWTYGIEHPYVDPTVAPEKWRRLGCGRVLVTVSELDLFRPRGIGYVEGLRRSGWGGEVELYETRGEDHCYHLSQLTSEKARKEMEAIVAFFRRSPDSS